jgi:hypothetical protein
MEDTTTPTDPTPEEKVPSRYKSIDELLKLAKVAIDSASSQPDLAEPLAKKGYDSTEMANAKVLFTQAETLYLSQKDKYGDKVGAKDEFDALREEIEEDYNDHIDLARIVLKNNRGDLEKLQLNGKRKQAISGWMAQAKTFYTNALASTSIKEALAKKGVTEPELLTVQAKLADLENKETAKYQKRGQAQSATAERDNAIDDLLEWYREFIDTAKVTFRKTPQLLEKLGIVVKE